MKRHCPIAGCDRPRRRGDAMCAEHWRMVPAELKPGIEAWADKPFSRGYIRCLDRAINAVIQRMNDNLAIAMGNHALKLKITVRYTAGTYIARANGKTASCTAGAQRAIEALVDKHFAKYNEWHINQLASDDDAAVSIWEAIANEIRAA
jgi:hypothetical protein